MYACVYACVHVYVCEGRLESVDDLKVLDIVGWLPHVLQMVAREQLCTKSDSRSVRCVKST